MDKKKKLKLKRAVEAAVTIDEITVAQKRSHPYGKAYELAKEKTKTSRFKIK